MGKRIEDDHRSEARVNEFTFSYKHPSRSTCPKGRGRRDSVTRTFNARSQKDAEILAENTQVLCDQCGTPYSLNTGLGRSGNIFF
ncbi:hypothetical protein KBB12_00665 [Candidatus Woesebacteria bacterium]|nr:hypothetical protein [Candidatus Woesebacteria bacterium]